MEYGIRIYQKGPADIEGIECDIRLRIVGTIDLEEDLKPKKVKEAVLERLQPAIAALISTSIKVKKGPYGKKKEE